MKDLLIITMPTEAVTMATAKRIEQEMMQKTQQDVVVVSPNVKMFRLEPLSAKEVAGIFPKGSTVEAGTEKKE